MKINSNCEIDRKQSSRVDGGAGRKRRRFVMGMAAGAGAASLTPGHWLPLILNTAVAGQDPQTWATVDGVRYGAKPDSLGSIGGNCGYGRLVSDGTVVARTFSEVESALATAKEGDIVFVPGDVSIDLTNRPRLHVPEGVTLASNRGQSGSQGALFWSDAKESDHSIELSKGSRATGIRVRGPFHEPEATKTGNNATRGILTRGNHVEIDNCEVYDHLHAGVYLRESGSTGHEVHHNHIHHCWGEGLGYGVVMNGSSARIHHNLFNANRHSTAHNGRYPSSYVVEENVCLELMVTHCFDMHSSPDDRGPGPSGDGGGCAVMVCRNNTTTCVKHHTKDSTRRIAYVRGTPYTGGSLIEHNWLWHPTHWEVGDILRAPYGGVVVGQNLWAGQQKIVR